MATKKRATSRSRTTQSKSIISSIKRFLKVVSISAITTFSIASCALNPQLRDWGAVDNVLSQFEQIEFPWSQKHAVVEPSTDNYVQTSFAQCPQFFPDQRPPLVPNYRAQRELCFSAFAILHSGNTKTPVFVAQRLNRQMLANTKNIKRVNKFYEEARLPSAERAVLGDYRASGYSRGHMAPAGDMYSDEAMAQSFSLANMVPQNQRHNAGAWSKVEGDTRKYVSRAAGDVYIFTGPVYTSSINTIGTGKVAIPDYIYKLVYDATTKKSWVHWHEHSPDTKVSAPISYEQFVQRTGLHLLPSITP